MESIQLERGAWRYDPAVELGPHGGFGEVFRGEGNDGPVAVKRLKLTAGQASYREMALGSVLAERTLVNVVPVLDYGLDAETERYFLVMPICDESLAHRISRGGVELQESISISQQIIAGLLEVDDIVHRDLKPGNILYHSGRWKIADFGIAKFTEDSTSLQTLRDNLTPSFGAPEQWRNERPTHATDVYALGCILYCMLSGGPPFTGSIDEVRDAHLHAAPKQIENIPARLSSVISLMLRKPPEVRPTLERCAEILHGIGNDRVESGVRGKLASVGRQIAETEAIAEAALHAEQQRLRRRQELAVYAEIEFERLQQKMFSEIAAISLNASIDGRALVLGDARLFYDRLEYLSDPISRDDFEPLDIFRGPYTSDYINWDVVVGARMGVVSPRWDANGYTWGSTVFFGCPPGKEAYRWYEVGFQGKAKYTKGIPFGLEIQKKAFKVAITPDREGEISVAFGPWPIDAENQEDFIERWMWLSAQAATRELRPPSVLPLSDGFWRS